MWEQQLTDKASHRSAVGVVQAHAGRGGEDAWQDGMGGSGFSVLQTAWKNEAEDGKMLGLPPPAARPIYVLLVGRFIEFFIL